MYQIRAIASPPRSLSCAASIAVLRDPQSPHRTAISRRPARFSVAAPHGSQSLSCTALSRRTARFSVAVLHGHQLPYLASVKPVLNEIHDDADDVSQPGDDDKNGQNRIRRSNCASSFEQGDKSVNNRIEDDCRE